MKKILVLVIFAVMVFLAACGEESKKTIYEYPDEEQGRKQGELYGECYPNGTCNEGLVCEIKDNVCLRDSQVSDNDADITDSTGDSDTDDPDTAPDSSDSEPDADTTEPVSDSGDSADDEDTDTSDSGDDADSEPDDNSDTSDSGDDADSEPDDNSDTSDSGDDADSDTDMPEPTEVEKCATAGGYYNGTSCRRVAICDDLPSIENIKWNGNSSYIQTLDEGVWTPEISTVYSDESCDCCFKCKEGLFWNVDHCEPESQPEPTEAEKCATAGGYYNGTSCRRVAICDDLPSIENIKWNGNSSYIQTLDEGVWIPEVPTVYSDESCDCCFKCKENYFWNGSECVNPCASDPCGRAHALSGTCNPTAWDKYTCGCEENYFWNGSECVNPCDGDPCGGNFYCVPLSFQYYGCYDHETGLTWSKRYGNMPWDSAVSHCESLNSQTYGYGWHLPNISELRTLIQNCPGTEPGGSCGVTHPDHLSLDDWNPVACDSCGLGYNGQYSKFGNTGLFWSSSTTSDDTDYAWGVSFNDGVVFYFSKDSSISYVRCVR